MSCTQTIFYKIQELYQSMAYMATVVNDGENICYYNVVRVDACEQSVRKVMEDKLLNLLSCSCRKFESCGFVCRHIFSIISLKNQVHAPLSDIYVLRRWTKSAKSYGGSRDGRGTCDSNVVLNHNSLRRLAANIVEDALLNEEKYKLAFSALESLKCTFNTMSNNYGGQSSTPSITHSERIFNEPKKVRAKGSGKRLKGGKETSTKNDRRCKGCGLKGQSQDKRNCPLIKNRNDTA